jgi:hypothetical protein
MEEPKSRMKRAVDIAMRQLQNSSELKKARFAKINEAEMMLLGKVKQRSRTLFNVPLPVLSGFYDKICADLDDPLQVKVKNTASKNLIAIRGINASFSIERKSLRPEARWDYKDRQGRKYAIATSRAVHKIYSTEGPYQNILQTTNPFYFHCQGRLSQGAGILENHWFAGEEAVMKTKRNLVDGMKEGIYDRDAVKLLLERSKNKDYLDKLSEFSTDMDAHFRALNMDPDANNYVGEVTFQLCEWVLELDGKRHYLLFDPWTRTGLRLCPLTDIQPSNLYPWVSYTTHEDDQNFWTTSILADILYPIADSIVTLFNQDLTNRAKRNMNSRYYDREMVKNVAKLDEAQYRPDTLVPIETFGGTRKISDGVYQFTTPELTGTVDLINWLTMFTGEQVGSDQNIPNPKKGGNSATNNIIFAEIQQLSKRVDYRSHSYTEAWGELMLRYIDGLKDNLSDKEAIDMLGPELGFGFKDALREVDVTKDDIAIISTKEQNAEDAMKKQQKNAALDMIGKDPVLAARANPEWRLEKVLADVGGWEKEEVEEAMDLRGMGGEQEQFAEAELAIKILLKGDEPDHFWNATVTFQRKLLDFERQHHVELMKKKLSMKFLKYVRDHAQTVAENMAQLAVRLKQSQQAAGGAGGAQPQGKPAGGAPAPQGGAAASPQPGAQVGPSQPQVGQAKALPTVNMKR